MKVKAMATTARLFSAGLDIAGRLAEARNHVRMDRWHRYEVETGKGLWSRMPSVTKILSHAGKGDALVGWAANCQSEADIDVAWDFILSTDTANASKDQLQQYMRGRAHEWRRRRDAAADLGTQVHKLIEQECRRMLGLDVESAEVSDEARYVFHEWADWAKACDLRPVAMETPVYSLTHRYAGTFDLLAYVNDELVIVDWKSKDKAGCYPEHRLQSIAYRHAVSEMGLPMPGGLIVRLPKLGPDLAIEPIPINDDPETLLSAFLNLRRYSEWAEEMKAS